MVKIIPNAPNLDHAKKNDSSRALVFENRIIVQRNYFSHGLCHFCGFFFYTCVSTHKDEGLQLHIHLVLNSQGQGPQF